jgi:hypothetical protein
MIITILRKVFEAEVPKTTVSNDNSVGDLPTQPDSPVPPRH